MNSRKPYIEPHDTLVPGHLTFTPYAKAAERPIRAPHVGTLMDMQTAALLRVEWDGRVPSDSVYGGLKCCPDCKSRGVLYATQYNGSTRHRVPCLLDEALTEAGLRDSASRDAERVRRGIRQS
jgi:hypothetical protein